MRKKTVYVLSCIVILLFCLYVSPSVNAGSAEEEVLQVEKNWIKAFTALDFESMSSLYWKSPKATEFSPDVFSQGYDTILGGMKEFFSPESPHKSKWSDDDEQVIMLSDNVAIIIGYHDLVNVADQSKSRHRFTRVVQKIGGKWLIVHNHESRAQTTGAPATGAPATGAPATPKN